MAPACPKLAESQNPYGLLKHYNICTKCVSHKFNKRIPCIRRISCDICKQEHITALHGKSEAFDPINTCLSSSEHAKLTSILLPTAVVKFVGRTFDVEKRVLIDVCSQASYVEEQLCQALRLKKVHCNVDISGVGEEITANIRSMVVLKFEVSYPEPRTIEVNAFVMASQLFLEGTISFGGLLLQNTRFGWMVMGSDHKKMSDEFMQEYIAMGRMSIIPKQKHGVRNGNVYYIPYHSVLKSDSVTTKLRNVFNASAKTSFGVSLNQTIHPGPKLQTKIFDVITRIRHYKYIYSSDVTKLYRQILLLEEDRSRLRVLYRENRNSPLQEYSLNTVTYGMDCAPWQAIRTIHQVAEDHSPNAKILEIIKNSFYIDDLFHGADTILDCQQQIDDIIAVLNKGRLPLTKWMSNNTDVLENVDESRKLKAFLDFSLSTESIKILGIRYFPHEDVFGFKVIEFKDLKFTKRGMLSITASLYDPLGWILPVIMMFRILIQKMWSTNLAWDDNIDCKMKDNCQKFIRCLPSLEQIRVPRWMGSYLGNDVELIGFSDASGDVAVVYSRIKVNGSYKITFIAAKGRVTPLKTKQNLDTKLCTIPKMELEGMCLLVELLSDVKSNFPNLNLWMTAYTDSQVVISWIRKIGLNTEHY